MSKQKTATVTKGLSPKTQKAIIISVICVVTAIAITLGIVLTVSLNAPSDKTIASTNTPTSPSSSLTIKNGNFEYVTEEEVMFPKTAQNWSKYGYSAPTTRSQGYKTLTAADNVNTLMGVVSVTEEDWAKVVADLEKQGVTATIANPGKPADSNDDNVYMIHNKTATAASIYSSSFTVAASTSVKITVYMKGNVADAFVMVKTTASSALEESTSGTRQWYAYNFAPDASDVDENGWHKEELYIFNQMDSSKTLYFNAGLGNVYNNDTAEGTLFIDDISYETVTANEYRKMYNEDTTTAYTVKQDVTANEVSYAELVASNDATASYVSGDFNTATFWQADDAKVDGESYSPFVSYADAALNQTIYALTNNGTQTSAVGVTTTAPISVEGPSVNKRVHVSVWVRVASENLLTSANIYLMNGEDVEGSFENIRTAKDIVSDKNCGWAQYNFYVKPSQINSELSLLVTLGSKDGYVAHEKLIPDGTLYVTQPAIELISQDEYADATSGTYTSKIDLSGATASTGISNGSFSTLLSNVSLEEMEQGATLLAPQSWTAVFAGDNIFKNGVHEDKVNKSAEAVEYGVQFDEATAPTYDDGAKGYLVINNKVATSFGLLSESFTLDAKTVTVISVMAKGTNANIYLIENGAEAPLAKLAADTSATADDAVFNRIADENGWTRFYIVVATGDNSKSVKLALFNGEIDSDGTKGTSNSVASFDQATVTVIGTYTRNNAADKIYEKQEDGTLVFNADLAKEITYTATDGYDDYDEIVKELEGKSNAEVTDIRFDESEVTKPVSTTTDDADDDDNTNTNTNSGTDTAALIVSIITSALLVAVLLVVLVIKFFRRKK